MPSPSAHARLQALIIDDEKNIRTTLGLCLESLGCEVHSVGTAESGLRWVAQHPLDLVFLDLRLPDQNGLELLPLLLQERPSLKVVVFTAYATIDTAVEAIKRGAFHYLPKPFTVPQLRLMVEQVQSAQRQERQQAALVQRLAQEVPSLELETHAPRMRETLQLLERAAQADVSVLLRGESGCGKGVLAHYLHQSSPRHERPFVVVNCPTLSDELLASELFGHARGAFTGAVRDQAGRVEAAQGGTLFLDEIGEISPSLQTKLLRFLQDKQFERLGESRTRKVDVRIVAATHRNLEADVQAGRFREDLLFRLNVIELRVPALRERPEDILMLAQRFLTFFATASQKPVPQLSRATEQALLAHPWPGNVRELRNTLERALILWPGPVIEPEALPWRTSLRTVDPFQVGGDFTVEALEREHILRVLARMPTLAEAAQVLGIEASTLWRKRKKYEQESL